MRWRGPGLWALGLGRGRRGARVVPAWGGLGPRDALRGSVARAHRAGTLVLAARWRISNTCQTTFAKYKRKKLDVPSPLDSLRFSSRRSSSPRRRSSRSSLRCRPSSLVEKRRRKCWPWTMCKNGVVGEPRVMPTKTNSASRPTSCATPRRFSRRSCEIPLSVLAQSANE